MPNIYLDIETYSTVDLKKCGVDLYTRNCEILMLWWAFEGGPVTNTGYKQLAKYCADPSIYFVAHNAGFERLALLNGSMADTALQAAFQAVPLERWRCSMVKAASASLPMSLEDCSSALGAAVEVQKMQAGKKLIKLFCMPTTVGLKRGAVPRRIHPADAPAEWEQFNDYCRQDVEVCRWVWNTIPGRNYDGHPSELSLWHLDQRINDRGVPVDSAAVRKVAKLINHRVSQINAEASELTGGAVTKLTQVQAIHAWMQECFGVTLPDLQSFTIEQALKHPRMQRDKYAPVRRMLELRQQGSKASNSKYAALLNTHKGRIRHILQFCGAGRTGRWAGRMVQPQNFPRQSIKNADSVIEDILNDDFYMLYDDEDIAPLASQILRGMFKAPDGYMFVVADLSQIEARVVAWLADDYELLTKIASGVDIYRELAAEEIFKKPAELVTDDERFSGKVGSLACSYQGHAKAVCKMAQNYGAVLSEEQGADIANAWRRRNSAIVDLWSAYEEAVRQTLRDRTPVKVGHCVFRTAGDYLLVKLPSGRYLHYMHPEATSSGLRFMGVDSYTKQWTRIDAYGGKFTENITQAVARDVLARGMMRVEARGYEVVMTVHDEIVALVKREEVERGDKTAAKMVDLIADCPPWLRGCPLAADGYEAVRYRK
jgi:DNA polymerase bacteriophage-type